MFDIDNLLFFHHSSLEGYVHPHMSGSLYYKKTFLFISIVSDALFPPGDGHGRRASTSPYPHTPLLVHSLPLYQQLFHACTPTGKFCM